MHQRISRRSALISGGAALFLSVTGQFSEHSPALATHEEDILEVFNRENSPSHFFRIPFMVSTANDTLVVGCDANRATTGDSADNIDALIRRKPNASRYSISDGWEAPSLIKPLEMRDYSNKYGYAPASSSVIDGAIIEDSVRHRLMIVIDLWPGTAEYSNTSTSPQMAPSTVDARENSPWEMASPPLPDVTCSCSRRTTSQGTPTD